MKKLLSLNRLILYLKIFFIGFFIYLFTQFLIKNFQIGIDTQSITCLPYRFYLIKKNNYIAFYSDIRASRYFPPGSIFIKKIVGKPGDIIDTVGDSYFVNGKFVGKALKYDLQGHPLKHKIYKNYKLKPGEYFVMGTNKYSYDSRYWGVVHENQIIGNAYPIF